MKTGEKNLTTVNVHLIPAAVKQNKIVKVALEEKGEKGGGGRGREEITK